MGIAENVRTARENINHAAISAGRDPSKILLLAATKMNDAQRIQQAIKAGVDICGENRVQEMLEKHSMNAYEGCPLHFIGHLQKNKVKQVVGLAELIHGVDDIPLLETVNKEARKKGLIQDLLLEVNIGSETSKSGFSPDEIGDALSFASSLDSIRVRGLMCIPPICLNSSENRPYFARMEQLFVDNSGKKYDNVFMDFLSMGMSGDYTEAVAFGANILRLGSAIFGPRVY
ncbi:MAG: YggS family pyridoxal phosphate-dependent enzyme [Oscillospiraceae bacterium]|nr:YggS family pyridoxal phosphate-dependent enzyme [Oscillospiraceae bacterium]